VRVVSSVLCGVVSSESSRDRSMMRCFDLFRFMVRVGFSGEAIDPESWLPDMFFCIFLFLSSFDIPLNFCSCFLVSFSRLDNRRLAASCWEFIEISFSVAFAIAKAVAAVALMVSSDFILALRFCAAVVCLSSSFW
jgi:hypothetical protein